MLQVRLRGSKLRFLSGVPIWVVGRADMQPPFKRTYPGSTPGRPTKSWAFGRTVMLLTLNQVDTGSTPVAPTKFYPCDAIGRHDLLKTGFIQVQILSGVLAEIELWCALRSHKPSRTGYPSGSKLQIPAPLPNAGVAQRQSNRLVSDGLRVQLLSPA